MNYTNNNEMISWGGNGPILHLAHANSYHPGTYLSLINLLKPHFDVYSILARPFHSKYNQEDFSSFYQLRDDFLRIAEAQKWENIIGIGHSQGSLVSMLADIKHPGLFSKLILIEPPIIPQYVYFLLKIIPYQYSKHLVPPSKIALNRRHKWMSKEEAFDFFRIKTVFSKFSDETLWNFIHFGLNEDENGEFRLVHSKYWESKIYCSITNPWPLVKRMTTPSLCIRAGETDVIKPESWKKWQSTQKHASFLEIPETTHLVPFESHEILAQHIIEFAKN